MTINIIIGSLLFISTVTLVRAELVGNIKQRYIFKPISALLMGSVILFSLPGHHQMDFVSLLLVGMVFCVAGDIALMFESNKAFTIGLSFFLLGHIVYALAILRVDRVVTRNGYITLLLVTLAVVVFFFLFSGLEKMKLPVLLYIIAISVMVHTAAMTFYSDYFNQRQAIALTLGAVLFYISDAILAVNRFKIPFKLNKLGLLAYFGGQYLIALSVTLG